MNSFTTSKTYLRLVEIVQYKHHTLVEYVLCGFVIEESVCTIKVVNYSLDGMIQNVHQALNCTFRFFYCHKLFLRLLKIYQEILMIFHLKH